MDILHKALEIIELPKLVLIKDLSFEEGFQEDPSFKSGKFIAYSEDLFELRSQIPKPEFPTDERQKELFKFKFGNENKDSGYFTDLPSDLYDDVADSKIFSTSYTIIWLVPDNINRTVSRLLLEISQGYTKEETRESFLDRMIVYPPDSIKDMNDERTELGFLYAVQEAFTQRISGTSN